MTGPNPGFEYLDPEEMRKTWLGRYLRMQARQDTKLRTILLDSAKHAQTEVSALETNSTFSAGVRTAQIRLLMTVVKEITNDLFREIKPVLSDGQRDAASGAVDSFRDTDRAYLEAAFRESGNVRDFVEGQRQQARVQVANAVSKLYGFEFPLSGRVYRTRSLANRWVQNTVTRQILVGASAREIAKSVSRSIRADVPGGVGYAALRLGRTELNNAFHTTSVNLAKDRPWVEGMLWNLSSTHEIDPTKPEICETYSGRVFDVENVPKKPHPQCRCYTTPQLEAYETFIRHLTAGQYRSWITDAA